MPLLTFGTRSSSLKQQHRAINGHFTATGGQGNDIISISWMKMVCEFQEWTSDRTYYNSGKVTQAKIGAANLARNLPPHTR